MVAVTAAITVFRPAPPVLTSLLPRIVPLGMGRAVG